MINWQPIETAPQDGTDIIIYDSYDVWKAYYSTEDQCWYESGQQLDTSLFHQPTLWLPISDLLKPLGHL